MKQVLKEEKSGAVSPLYYLASWACVQQSNFVSGYKLAGLAISRNVV